MKKLLVSILFSSLLSSAYSMHHNEVGMCLIASIKSSKSADTSAKWSLLFQAKLKSNNPTLTKPKFEELHSELITFYTEEFKSAKYISKSDYRGYYQERCADILP